MNKDIKHYTVGFLFRTTAPKRVEVALILKTHPAWQMGKLNGIGGSIEKDEPAADAMRREFLEEAGADITQWECFCNIHYSDRIVRYFRHHAAADFIVRSMTEERVNWYLVSDLPLLSVIPNLLWLIPMAIDHDRLSANMISMPETEPVMPATPENGGTDVQG